MNWYSRKAAPKVRKGYISPLWDSDRNQWCFLDDSGRDKAGKFQSVPPTNAGKSWKIVGTLNSPRIKK